MRKLQESLEILQKSNAAHRLKKHKLNHKNSDKATTSVTVINNNSTDFRYEIENGGTQFQSTIDEVIKQLDQLYHFNNERFMLHTEMEKLQALIDDMHKKNEERINLDNERRELQTLQEQVAELQNQNMVMALSYSEAKRLMEANFDREREEFLHEVQRLLNKAEESEEAREQDKEFHVLEKHRTIMNIQHCQTTPKNLQEQENGTCLGQLEELCNVCKRIEKEMVNFTEACQNLSNIHSQQSSIDQVQKVLVGLTDRLVSQTDISQHDEERSIDDPLREEVQVLQSQLSEVLQKGMESYEALEARNKAIDTNMIVVKSQIEKIQDSLHGMKAHLELRDEKLDRLRVCHTRAVKVLRDEKSKVSSLRAQIDSMEKSIEEAVEDKVMLHATSAENEMKIKALEAENAELQHNLNNLQMRMDTKETEHEAERKHDEKLHQATVTELEREIEELQNENYQKTLTFNEKMKELQTEKLHERDEMVNRLRMHHERAMKEFKDEKLQLSHLRDHVDSMEKSMREAQEEKLRYQTMLNENDLKISLLLHENSELKRDVADLQMDIEENDKRHENLRDNDEKLHDAVVVEMKREIENIEKENEQNVLKLTEKIQNLQSERVILLDHNMELQNLVEFLNKEVEKWKRAKRPFFASK
ncbi:hypothetical protein RI129_010403 [Pyrocoelia pectoralis]|uniref:Uncharacterized protein n=1 Tax=Pyrocoelia pectoralis TaxID=417401 RepID=A0AAN7ZJV7_9COLE